ncbi:hypothetical protein F2Q69_00061524 [Brassica cretica]|uniref:Uncharacterized protein n=1 Tax=Brassica cretica TaxID=69181 RepID=A0A8S9RF85_BRACR|nr:hypothetical protein F2Q69_00061524 [Brassica cretica]
MHLGRRTLKPERAVGATSVTCAPYGVADKAIGATSQSEVLECPLKFLEVLGSIWDQKWQWKVLFERVEHRSGQWERPTTPAPDETKAARQPATGFGTRSERCILVDEL